MRKLTRKERAQGMVEFALVIPIVLVVVFGIIEFGRLLFTYSVVFTSSREAARYGAAAGDVGGYIPHYLDCTGIKGAGTRIGSLASIQESDILIRYDHGSDASRFSNACPPGQTVSLGDRIDIQVQADYKPIVPLVNIPAFTITSNTARTILKDIVIEGTPQPAPGSLPSVYFAQETQDVLEYSGGTTVQLVLSASSSNLVSVPFSVSGGSATPGVDFTINTASPAVIPVGSTSVNISISIDADTLDENDETIVITMGNPVNANRGTPDTHTITILDDDDPPTASFTSAASTVDEVDGATTLTVQLDTASGRNVTVPFSGSVISSTASLGADYNFVTSSPIVIPAGDTSASIDVSIVDDGLDEDDEEAIIVMGVPTNALRGNPHVYVLTILDNDLPPTVAFTTDEQETAEGVDLNVELQLSAPSGLAVTVPYSVGGTATRGEDADYTVPIGPVVIPAGETTMSIVVSVKLDIVDDAGETVVLSLGTPTNAGLGSPSVHTVTIVDAVTPEVYFEEEFSEESESAGSMSVNVQLSAATALDVYVPINATGTATNNQDFTLPSAGITIPAGYTSRDLVVNIVNDALYEDNETVILTMGTPTNAVPGTPTEHTATILDDDPPPIVYFVPSNQSGYEDAGDLPVTVRLNSASGLDVLVPFTLSGSATEGADYTVSPSGSVVIPAGNTEETLTIQFIDDDALDAANIGEPEENVILTIENPQNATVDLSGVLPHEHTATILAWDCPSAASDPFFGSGGDSKKLIWEIQYSGTRSVNLLEVTLLWPTSSGTQVHAMTFGGLPIGASYYYPATLGYLDVNNPMPLWSGVFDNRQMITLFNKTPKLADGSLMISARFEHCLTFSKLVGN
jgi:Flp pilus assembly protein TadG